MKHLIFVGFAFLFTACFQEETNDPDDLSNDFESIGYYEDGTPVGEFDEDSFGGGKPAQLVPEPCQDNQYSKALCDALIQCRRFIR